MSDAVLVPRAKLERFRDAFAEELAAYDMDPPIHHLQQGYDDCVRLLSAASVVPLTDERIKQIADKCDEGQEPSEYMLAFARAVLSAAPVVREPLTDEQINNIWNAKDLPEHRSHLSPWGMDRIRAIIAAANGIGGGGK